MKKALILVVAFVVGAMLGVPVLRVVSAVILPTGATYVITDMMEPLYVTIVSSVLLGISFLIFAGTVVFHPTIPFARHFAVIGGVMLACAGLTCGYYVLQAQRLATFAAEAKSDPIFSLLRSGALQVLYAMVFGGLIGFMIQRNAIRRKAAQPGATDNPGNAQ